MCRLPSPSRMNPTARRQRCSSWSDGPCDADVQLENIRKIGLEIFLYKDYSLKTKHDAQQLHSYNTVSTEKKLPLLA